MTDIESRVRDSRQEILRCIKEPTIVAYLEASSVISQEDGSRLKTMYLSGETTKAGEEMLACIIDSQEPGKWTSFIEALENAEYPYLKELLLCSNPEANNPRAEHAKKVLRLFTPSLQKNLRPYELIPQLYARSVINQEDSDLILATGSNRGITSATIVLLERIQCRLSPEQWYKEFLNALMETGYGHEYMVQSMEPDFVADPSAFWLLQSAISADSYTGSLNDDSDDSYIESFDDKTSYVGSSGELDNMETKATDVVLPAEKSLKKFQLELDKNALLGRNAITFAETGSGKTRIASHIIQKHLHKNTDEYGADYSDAFLKRVPTEKELSRLAERIGKEYRSLGFELGLTRPQLDHIEMDARNRKPVDTITAMLSEWVKKEADAATFQELKKAMIAKGIEWNFVFEGLQQFH